MDASQSPFITLDGSEGEGGGQIVRTALFLSTLLGRPFRVDRIRANRPSPGLKAQHVGIVRLLQEVCGARAEGVREGSPALAFEPAPPRPGAYEFDIGTAGSISLFLQTLLPVAMLAEGRIELRLVGGTDGAWAPTVDWFEHVYLARVSPAARDIRLDVERRGFHPKGGGRVRLRVEGDGGEALRRRIRERLGAPRLERGGRWETFVHSVAHDSLAARRVAERQADLVGDRLRAAGLPAPQVRTTYAAARSVGTSLTIWLVDERGNRLGADALGSLGKRAEEVGVEAADRLVQDVATAATVDRHLADHWAPWIALGAGAVRVPEATPHLLTNIAVCERFLGAGSIRLHGSILEAPPPSTP